MTLNRNADVMHARLARRGLRHANRQSPIEAARRLARLEVEVEGLSAQVTLDSLMMGTSSVQQPGVITAETRKSDEAVCAALAARIWTPAELAVFAALNAEGGSR